ncbi:MAG: biotin--[acetyl-CoA-carboxylase] ligase [Butyricicoccus sp.]
MVKDEVLRALERNRGTRFSGGRLAQELGVSRAAVWKAIEALRADGLAIESTPGGGYCLSADDDSLTAAGVASLLETEVLGRDLLVVPETGSTNTTIKQEYAASRAEGFTLIAEQQTAGRGRLGRTFCSPPGGGLYMSLLLRPHLPLDRLNFLTIAAAVAVCRAIESTAGFRPGIKWVNDVLMDGKKLCGILTEAAIEGETGAIDYAVLGIGVNLRLDRAALPDDVCAVAGALSDFTDTVPRRAALAAAILRELERVYRLLNAGDTAAVLAEYRALLCCLDQPVRVVSPAGSYDAVCRGVNDQGNLIVERPDGTRDTLRSGEISIRL